METSNKTPGEDASQPYAYRGFHIPFIAGISLGAQWLLAALAGLGGRAAQPDTALLTDSGKWWIQPEYDLPIFATGCALMLAGGFGAVVFQQRRRRRLPPEDACLTPCVTLIAAAWGWLVFLAAFAGIFWGNPAGSLFSAAQILLLFAVILVEFAVFVLAHYSGPSRRAVSIASFRISGVGLPDLLVLSGILLFLFIPAAGTLAGRILAREGFFHWNHFLLGPTLFYLQGNAFALDFYSQYGIGWPLLAAWISPWYALSHEHALTLASAYACLYFLGAYLLFHAVTGRRGWALCGTLLLALGCIFNPAYAAQETVWQTPTSTLLRHPMDVWFFLFLYKWMRSGKAWWAVGTGLTLGLAVLFVLDSAVPLAAVFGFLFIALLWNRGVAISGVRWWWWGVSALAALLVWCGGMVLASRGAFLDAPLAFLRAWVSGVTVSSVGGVGALPFLRSTSLLDMLSLMLFVIVFVLAVGAGLYATWTRTVSPNAFLLFALGVSGLSFTARFVWRTRPGSIILALPFLLMIAVVVVQSALKKVLDPEARSDNMALSWDTLLPHVTAPFLILAILLSPAFKAYPNVFTSAGAEQGETISLPLTHGHISGLPKEMRAFVADFGAVAEEVRAAKAQGKSVAVLSDSSTLFALETGIPLWGRNPTVYFNTFTWEQVRALQQDLAQNGPDVVFFENAPPIAYDADIWGALQETLRAGYRAVKEVGSYTLWERAR